MLRAQERAVNLEPPASRHASQPEVLAVPPVQSALAAMADELTADLPRLQQMLRVISVAIRVMFVLASDSDINAHKSKC